jgi:hypothetical protein
LLPLNLPYDIPLLWTVADVLQKRLDV